MVSRYEELRHVKGDALRRDPRGPSKRKRKWTSIKPDSAAAKEARSIYTSTIQQTYPPMKSGFMNTKIGKAVQKGAWAGMPIYTLTLEERKTCGPCKHTLDCYGNTMRFARRMRHGDTLEQHLEVQLAHLALTHPQGFVVRLHVLGDFYSVAYATFWLDCLNKHPELRIYGYTARKLDTRIGLAVYRMTEIHPDRVAMRWSDYDHATQGVLATISIAHAADAPDDAIICPAQQQKTACCATCALCWESPKRIAFMNH